MDDAPEPKNKTEQNKTHLRQSRHDGWLRKSRTDKKTNANRRKWIAECVRCGAPRPLFKAKRRVRTVKVAFRKLVDDLSSVSFFFALVTLDVAWGQGSKVNDR